MTRQDDPFVEFHKLEHNHMKKNMLLVAFPCIIIKIHSKNVWIYKL